MIALIGYCIVEPYSGDITQLAVDPDFRRQGVGLCTCSTQPAH